MNDIVMRHLQKKMRDERRGVKGTGRGRSRGRRSRDNADYNDYDDYDDYADYEDERDYSHGPLKLTKHDKKEWKNMMENSDGTVGAHYDMSQVMQAAEKLGIKFNDYTEDEFCICTNMMYSDYGRSIRKHVSPEKELLMCAELAKDFLEDEDGPEASEKLALYFHCIVNC